ncbi:hypothetical protein LLH06_18965 [Mucilaginibacter daejeonensis]|uniref:hypothetical protein n=1 Tax=Mucilaginibacter daejeonensis TaxID=398049 RepID=UPI001D17285B|nr:hypothetical protein [Mucilaginibacter daejeonensis]UEG53031.1 hypothetical protein LLH06_18965 [Mucilaginibacter daejeonensis]
MKTILILRKSILFAIIPVLFLNITAFTMKIQHWPFTQWVVIASACVSAILMLMIFAWLIVTLFGFKIILRKAKQVQ